MEIFRANKSHLEELSVLFDGYRIFYRQPSNLAAARKFLEERFHNEDSVIFIAKDENDKPLGFTQLYPSFSSVSMQRTYILNDLFVTADARGRGVGEAILEAAKQFARTEGSKGLTLETEITNPAQKLYERLGWQKDDEVFHYTWKAD